MPLLIEALRITNSLRLDEPTFDLSGEVDWGELLHHADGHSLTPLLFNVWGNAGQLDVLPEVSRTRMEQTYTDNAARNENIRHELLDVHEILTNATIPHVVLKGWPLVERLYAAPSERVLYDHDLLVPAEAAKRGQRALLAAGFRPRPTKDEWNEKHLPPVWRNDDYQWDDYLFDPNYPRPVELHTALWERGWRGLHVKPLTGLWSRVQERNVAGNTMQVLSDEDQIIHLSVHFAEHLVQREARLNQLLDLARLLRTAVDANWDDILERAGQGNVVRFVFASISLAEQIFGASLPPVQIWQSLTEQTPLAFREWLAAQGAHDVLTSDYRQPAHDRTYLLTFLAAHSIAEKFGIVRFAALPPIAHLMHKYAVTQPGQGVLMYPRFMLERAGRFGRDFLLRSRS